MTPNGRPDFDRGSNSAADIRQRLNDQRGDSSDSERASQLRQQLNQRMERSDSGRPSPGSDSRRSPDINRSQLEQLRQRFDSRNQRGSDAIPRGSDGRGQSDVRQRLEELRNSGRLGTPRGDSSPDRSPFPGRDQRPDRGERPDIPGQRPDRGDLPDRGDRPDRGDGPGFPGIPGDRPDRGDRPDTPGDRPDRGDMPDRGDRPDVPGDRTDRGGRPGTPGDRPDRGDMPDRGDRPGTPGDRPGDGDRPDRGDRPGDGDRPDRGDRPGDGDRPDRGDRPGDGDRPDRGDRPGDGDRPDRGDRPGDGDRPDRGDRPGDGDRDRFDDWRDRFDDRFDDRRGDRRGDRDFDDRFRDRRDFDRDWDNQVLNYLRLGNPDLMRRYVNNGRRDDFFRDHDFRVRHYGPRGRDDYWRRYHGRIDFDNWGRSIARHVWRLRAAQLSGYRYDRSNYLYRDYYGRPLGVYYRDIFRPGARFIVPHFNRNYRGSYYCYGGDYYYYPETYAMGPSTVTTSEPVEMEFGGFDFVVDLAHRFERMANDICLDMHYNYRDNPDFDRVYRDAYTVLTAAKEIERAAELGNQQEAADLLYGLDQLFYYVYDQTASWQRYEQKQVGDGDLMAKFSVTEAILQHLMYNVGVEPSFDVVDEAAPQPAAAP